MEGETSNLTLKTIVVVSSKWYASLLENSVNKLVISVLVISVL